VLSAVLMAAGIVQAAEISTEPPEAILFTRDYLYQPVENGIETHNGKGRFNRPLFTSVERPFRAVALSGDRPEFMYMELWGKGGLYKLANLMLGYSGKPWLSEIEPVTARYELGVMSYCVDEGADAVVLDAVRTQAFDGLVLRIRRDDGNGAPLVFAMGAECLVPPLNPTRLPLRSSPRSAKGQSWNSRTMC